jgi:hypothetical protein
MFTSYIGIETFRRYEMEQLTYGEMIASHLDEVRKQAAIERAARRAAANGSVAGWRVWSGRFLVSAGERLAGCAELARGEAAPAVEPVVRVLG